MCTRKCRDWFHLIISIIGVLVGLIALVVFFHHNNLDGICWSLIAVVYPGYCWYLHALHLSNKLQGWHSEDTLNDMKIVAVIGIAMGAAGVFWYIFSGLYYNIPLLPIEHSKYLVAVLTFVISIWALALFLYCRRYINTMAIVTS